MTKKVLQSVGLILSLLLLTACVHTPTALPPIVGNSPDVQQVQQEPDAHQQATVRWGGTVVAVENNEGHSLIEIVGRPLSRYGRPLFNDHSDGRFIARVNDFIDPELYQANKEITVVGKVDGSLEKKIGDSDYTFPVVAVSTHRLWKTRNARFARRGYYGYDDPAYAGIYRNGYRSYYGYSQGYRDDPYYDHRDLLFDWWSFSLGWNGRSHNRFRTHFNLNWWWRH